MIKKKLSRDYTLSKSMAEATSAEQRLGQLEVFAVAVASALCNISYHSRLTNLGHQATVQDDQVCADVEATMLEMAKGFSAMSERLGTTEADHVGRALAMVDFDKQGRKHDA